ncbi:N-6 DNA methylase [Halobacillus sp. A1]|uniref:N-6 DNA methylase n=1 Tax=Halobacillus sp. A1 TaxID=2880262 RepID=UPI0020A663F5|nr:N-6 DNA methylase [Halobacillus sp. A1]MCP3032621.1 N-6 DNA methylase [Halobacillus sp. A1]
MIEVQIDNGKNKIFAPLKNNWLILTPEEHVRQNYITILVNDYGYDLKQMRQEVTVNNSNRGLGKARADIVIWKSEQDKLDRKHALIVVECKAENVKIQRGDFFQGANYAGWARAKFFVCTNEKQTRFFKTNEDTMPDEFNEEIRNIPHASDINDNKKINALLNETRAFTRDEFQNLLFSCHNVIRNNDKLSPEMAFDEISKILFMKIRYERTKGKERQVFSKKRFLELKESYLETDSTGVPFYQHIFNQTKLHFINEEIFDKDDTIKIREASFLEIVRLLEKYNLSDTSDDVKGIAFEEFLGKTFRGNLGQFFTPRSVVSFMTSVLDPQETEIVCDPCCGTGGFLISAYEHIRTKIENEINSAKREIKSKLISDEFDNLPDEEQSKIINKINEATAILNEELDPTDKNTRIGDLSYNRIFGTDAEPRSARTAKMNMIMHGDGHGGVYHHDGLINIGGVFEERFDVILTNPPFGARISRDTKISEADSTKDPEKIKLNKERFGDDFLKAMGQVSNNIGSNLLDLFDLGNHSTLTEVLFMERCLKLLKPGGRMGIVLPEGVLNISQLQVVREYFEGKARILLITSIPQDVFIAAGANVKPSIVFLKKFTEKEADEYNTLKEKSRQEVRERYEKEIEEILDPVNKMEAEIKDTTDKRKKSQLRIQLRELRKIVKKDLIKIENLISEESKKLLKEYFDYDVPVVQVEKAGITSTGAVTDNELEDVSSEYNDYRIENQLWETKKNKTTNFIEETGIVQNGLGKSMKIYE